MAANINYQPPSVQLEHSGKNSLNTGSVDLQVRAVPVKTIIRANGTPVLVEMEVTKPDSRAFVNNDNTE
ncbi:MAG: hypothetical protein WAV41_02310 [Microgenomates group bacterium]